MHLSRLILNPRDKRVWRDLKTPRELHRTLMHGFPAAPGKQDDFRLQHGVLHRVEEDPETQAPAVLVQSSTQPDWTPLLKLDGYLSAPPMVRALPAWEEVLQPGRDFRFRLRANPTRKVDTKSGPDGARRNGKRRALRGAPAQIAWLARKAEQSGFSLLEAESVLGSPPVAVLAEDDRVGPADACLASVLFEGRLRVLDSAALASAIRAGIGPGKAFGFGLLSLAPG